MNVTLPVPDDLAGRLGSADEMSRRALEAFAAAEHRAGRLTLPEVRRVLGEDAPPAEAAVDARRTGGLLAEFQAFRSDKSLRGLDPAELVREGRR